MSGRDHETIGLVFSQFLDRQARSYGVNREMRLVDGGFTPERNPGLPRQRVEETLLRALQTRLGIPLQLDAECSVDHEFALTQYCMCRQRHDRQFLPLLCVATRRKAQHANEKADESSEADSTNIRHY